nr:ribonuclease II, chloroplastic/mitochondrial [Ipomoea batatas]
MSVARAIKSEKDEEMVVEDELKDGFFKVLTIEILKAMGMAKTASAAVTLLIDIGYLPVHVNLDLLKLSIRTDHPDEIVFAAESPEVDGVDLTHLKVYAIDVDEADEVSCSVLLIEARRRGTFVFLPTATYPMFPKRLAMQGMSLKQGQQCNAVTVFVILRSDGSQTQRQDKNLQSKTEKWYNITFNIEEESDVTTVTD